MTKPATAAISIAKAKAKEAWDEYYAYRPKRAARRLALWHRMDRANGTYQPTRNEARNT